MKVAPRLGCWVIGALLAPCTLPLAARSLAAARKVREPAAAKAPVMLSPDIGLSQRVSEGEKPALPEALAKPGAVYWGLFKICVDPAGKISEVSVLRSTGEPDRLDQPWLAGIKTWQYKPYLVSNKAVAFCHPFRMQLSGPPKPVMLAPEEAAKLRLTDPRAGEARPGLPPELNRAGMVVWGLYKYCVGTDGHVNHVNAIKGAHALVDADWIAKLKTWRFKPHETEGRATPFCSVARIQVASR